jgi:hypothetical protein
MQPNLYEPEPKRKDVFLETEHWPASEELGRAVEEYLAARISPNEHLDTVRRRGCDHQALSTNGSEGEFDYHWCAKCQPSLPLPPVASAVEPSAYPEQPAGSGQERGYASPRHNTGIAV